jgi:hypothetical protein
LSGLHRKASHSRYHYARFVQSHLGFNPSLHLFHSLLTRTTCVVRLFPLLCSLHSDEQTGETQNSVCRILFRRNAEESVIQTQQSRAFRATNPTRVNFSRVKTGKQLTKPSKARLGAQYVRPQNHIRTVNSILPARSIAAQPNKVNVPSALSTLFGRPTKARKWAQAWYRSAKRGR